MDPIARMVAAGAAGAAGGGGPTYVDDVFSTYLYDGNGGTQTITNGLDLSGEGGLVWIKSRDDTGFGHQLYDTERGTASNLSSHTSSAAGSTSSRVTAFNADGFDLGANGATNDSLKTYVSWSFRKQPGFFDVVTYSGTGSAHDISHSLGSEPGMIWYKPIDDSREWMVYHRSLGASQGLILNENYAAFASSDFGSGPTSTHFSVGNTAVNNTAGKNYVAYIFAHDDQSFGTNEDEAIIKCGSYTGAANTIKTVSVGFEPQWLMIKNTTRATDSYGSADWWMGDIMRQMNDENARALRANTADVEYNGGRVYPTSTGFVVDTEDNIDHSTNGDNYIYMAIRRPHKPPTAGTEVFDVGLRSGSSSAAKTNSSILTDMSFILRRDSSSEYNGIGSRLQWRHSLQTTSTDAHLTGWVNSSSPRWDTMTGFYVGGGNGAANTGNLIDFSFKRAPGFFDAVAYTGSNNSGSTSYNHNLEAVPELMVIKCRNAGGVWYVYSSATGNSKFLRLNGDNAESTGVTWTTPTATEFTAFAGVNATHEDYIVYLFASLDGVSKVGSYTGTGANYGNSVDVDCGFTAGARFVLIKRTDSGGDWYVWNSASGIVSGNDPYMLLNKTDSEVTNTDYIDPLNSGFTVTSSSGALNTLNATYLFLAIA